MNRLDILGFLLGTYSVCRRVCSDLLAHSLFILSYVETSLSGKSRLGCGEHVDDKAFHFVFISESCHNFNMCNV